MKTYLACAFSLMTLLAAPAALAQEAPAAAHKMPAAPPDFLPDFKASDTDHNGKLSWEEFLSGREGREGKPGSGMDGKLNYKWISHYVERFAAMDIDKDEALTWEEYAKGRLLNTFNDGRLRFICSDDKSVFICR